MKFSIMLIAICISIYIDRSQAEGHYSEAPIIFGADGGPDRRFMNQNLHIMGYMLYLVTKSRDAMRHYYGVAFSGCYHQQSLCWMTSKRFYMYNEEATNHPELSKQIPIIFYDQAHESVPELADLDLTRCNPREDSERIVLGMLQALDRHIELLKDRSKSFTSKHKPKPESDIQIYLKDLEELQKMFPIESLEAGKPDLICSSTGCDCLSKIYRSLMQLNFQLQNLWNDGLKSNME
uniref:Uncharacterized protein n=1 Tax=Trichobilharzia regenti TaxID=157069 RepID=A0AA85KLQ4_TRIRE|nr:unnamed protein product [Trichobilharzia regenti]